MNTEDYIAPEEDNQIKPQFDQEWGRKMIDYAKSIYPDLQGPVIMSIEEVMVKYGSGLNPQEIEELKKLSGK